MGMGYLNKARLEAVAMRRLRGLRAKRDGAGFEDYLVRAMGRAGWPLVRINDGCQMTGPGGTRFKRVAQPFDFIAFGPEPEKVDLFFDAKVRSGSTRIRASWLKGGLKKVKPSGRTKKDSTAMQVEQLKRLSAMGRRAGFVVFLKDTNEVWWVPIEGIERPMESAVLWGKLTEELRVCF